MEFQANNHTYKIDYYLADGIYPRWATFVMLIVAPTGKKQVQFHNAQVAARKDVERAFGILQAQFAIVRGPERFWNQNMLWYIMQACVIMHNMIIEDERGKNEVYGGYDLMGVTVQPRRDRNQISRFLEMYHDIHDGDVHDVLQKDVMDEWWKWNDVQRN
jgi:hypothetical protein